MMIVRSISHDMTASELERVKLKTPLASTGQVDETDNFIEDMKKGTSKILVTYLLIFQVAVRVRPLSYREIEADEVPIVKILDQKVVILLDPSDVLQSNNPLGKNRSKEQHYAFDFAFDQESGQAEIFSKTTKFLCEGVINGYNATVFAYGATGAGKTYTMLGTEENPGNMFLTLKELFVKINGNRQEREYTITVSFLEIYNEQIRDLINVSPEVLDLREDPLKGVTIAGISEMEVTTPEEILELLMFGNMHRTQEATGANETSSRSHAVLQIIVQHRDRDSGIEAEIRVGKLSLIDLAGSERASKTNNRGIRMIEGANINRSLLALGNCINALHENVAKNQTNYIPFRDSKLTRLLKDSLGGNCRTVMIANMSPGSGSYEDTHNTLKYSNRAKNIKTNIQRNVHNVEYHVSKYTQIIAQLKSEIGELKNQLHSQPLELVSPGRSPASTGPSEEFLNYRTELEQNFQEELRLLKRVHEIEQKQESLNISIIGKQGEVAQLIRDRGRENLQARIIGEEIDDLQQSLKDFGLHLEHAKTQKSTLSRIRENYQQEWKAAGLPKVEVEALENLRREKVAKLDSEESKRKEKKAENQVKAREIQLQRLYEQIQIRDQLLDQATANEHPQLIDLPTLMKETSSLPPILTNTPSSIKASPAFTNLNRNKAAVNSARRAQNGPSIYSSLPPMGPRESSEMRRGKEHSRLSNQRDLSLNDLKLSGQPVLPMRPNYRMYSLSKNSSGTALNSKDSNIFSRPLQLQSNHGSKLVIKNSKQNQFVKNLQQKQQMLKRPAGIGLTQDVQRRAAHAYEERKRSDSAVSSRTVSSTASSSTPTQLAKKRALAVKYGFGNGSGNRGYKYERSRDTGVPPAPVRSVALTMAARKKELQERFEVQQSNLEANKRKALESLNKRKGK